MNHTFTNTQISPELTNHSQGWWIFISELALALVSILPVILDIE